MQQRRFPIYGGIALVVCLSAWALSWLRIEPFYRYSFFPLWFGYILFIDALVVKRRGKSLLTRAGFHYCLLFLASSLFWWVFELLNITIQNWQYIFDQPHSQLAYFLISSLNFSTVLPAVMETAELCSTFEPLQPRLSPSNVGPLLPLWVLAVVELLGLICFVLPWIFPRYCFGLIWLCVVLMLDPINYLFRRKSALAHIAVGDWRFFVVVSLAGLCCGFLWEMWNFYALPKWYYSIPYVGFWKIFEMPLLGYTGYLPFALELFAMYQFVLLLIRQKEDYLAL